MIIVEDGSIVAGANSYVSEADFETYAAIRCDALTESAEVLLLKAMDYLESQSFVGSKRERSQPLQWPRTEAYIDGYEVYSTEIPKELVEAQKVIALAIDNGYDPLQVLTPSIKREKIDVLETEYQDGAMSSSYDPRINAAIRKLVVGSGGGLNFAVSRA